MENLINDATTVSNERPSRIFFLFIMTLKLGTLSDKSWLGSSPELLIQVFSYFILSEYSQSTIYYGNITSMPKILETSGHDINAFITELKDNLGRLLSRYFTKISIEVKDETINAADPKKNVSIYVDVTDDEGNVHNLCKVLQYENKVFKNIMDKIN